MLSFMLLSLLTAADLEIERAKLIGTWELVSVDRGTGPQQHDGDFTLTFEQGTGYFTATNRPTKTDVIETKVEFKVRRGCKHHEMDTVAQIGDESCFGCDYYRIRSDTLTICSSQGADNCADARPPTAFMANLDKHIHVYVFKRVVPRNLLQLSSSREFSMGILQLLILSLMTPTLDSTGQVEIPCRHPGGKVTGVSNLVKGFILSCCIRPGMLEERVLQRPMLKYDPHGVTIHGSSASHRYWTEYGFLSLSCQNGKVLSVCWYPHMYGTGDQDN